MGNTRALDLKILSSAKNCQTLQLHKEKPSGCRRQSHSCTMRKVENYPVLIENNQRLRKMRRFIVQQYSKYFDLYWQSTFIDRAQNCGKEYDHERGKTTKKATTSLRETGSSRGLDVSKMKGTEQCQDTCEYHRSTSANGTTPAKQCTLVSCFCLYVWRSATHGHFMSSDTNK